MILSYALALKPIVELEWSVVSHREGLIFFPSSGQF